MIFIIEEVDRSESIYSYQGSCVFDELLEYYAFLNVWAVSSVGQEDKAEGYYYKHDAAAELAELLRAKSGKITFILQNIS